MPTDATKLCPVCGDPLVPKVRGKIWGETCGHKCGGRLRFGDPIVRLWSQFNIPDDPDSCWEFNGFINGWGYGMCYFDGRTRPAHCAAWMATNGPIPKGMKVCHACDNPGCGNPRHLWLGTTADNNNDMARKCRHGIAKLNPDSVRAIRSEYAAGGTTMKSLGMRFGVTEATIHSVVHRKNWQHVE